MVRVKSIELYLISMTYKTYFCLYTTVYILYCPYVSFLVLLYTEIKRTNKRTIFEVLNCSLELTLKLKNGSQQVIILSLIHI